MTLAFEFEDANSKLVGIVSVVDIDSDEHVDDGLVQILKLKYSSDFEVKYLVKMFKLKF